MKAYMCPLRMVAPGATSGTSECLREACAWWVPFSCEGVPSTVGVGSCAIVDIARTLEVMDS